MKTALLALLPVSLLVGCVRGPSGLAAQAPESLALHGSYQATPAPVPRIANNLLDLFDNAQLRSLVRRALSNNPDLRLSLARLEEAGFNARQANAARNPTLTGNASASRSNTPLRSESALFEASLDARWELDVWGRIRAGVSASAADQAAAVEAKMAQLRAQGHKPFNTSSDGYVFRGIAYVDGFLELRGQLRDRSIAPDAIYLCSGAHTHVGLVVAAKALGEDLPVVGISPSTRDDAETADRLSELAARQAQVLEE